MNQFAQDGWVPQGGLAICVDPQCPKGTGLVYAQAVVRLFTQEELSDERSEDANAPAGPG